jgi:hypothetical protein
MTILSDYANKPVRLTDERLEHFRGRLEKAGMDQFISETLAKPEQVIRSKWDPACVLSYRFYQGTAVGDKWLCVVVKHKGDDAFVLTAYPTDRIKEGAVLWKRM